MAKKIVVNEEIYKTVLASLKEINDKYVEACQTITKLLKKLEEKDVSGKPEQDN